MSLFIPTVFLFCLTLPPVPTLTIVAELAAELPPITGCEDIFRITNQIRVNKGETKQREIPPQGHENLMEEDLHLSKEDESDEQPDTDEKEDKTKEPESQENVRNKQTGEKENTRQTFGTITNLKAFSNVTQSLSQTELAELKATNPAEYLKAMMSARSSSSEKAAASSTTSGDKTSEKSEKALSLSQERKEDDFEAVFALLVYGLFLFPNIDNFVDMNAIKIFMKGNRVPTLLGETYYSIHLRKSYGKGMITSCTPLLYKWHISHLPNTNDFWDLKEGQIWSLKIMTLTNTDIVCTNSYFCRMKTLDSCGDFPNVPLLGTKGGINSRPVLARRQFGFPMDKRPRNILLDGFFLKEKVENKEFRERTANAWHPSHRKEIKDWKTKGDLSPESYEEWINSIVVELRMPYLPEIPPPPMEKPVAPVVSPPTIEDLQESLKKMKKSRDHWKKNFE
ncbi:uncharacterized protein LOC131621915 [Vicia villosa]|uniref:uncharacterized protein LOC131621915 n=1 Tax=Vicia villosa TaxID=3911 RepID=UPI00273AE055|nr:uncharacterized protein LOC131621915 [Vicia villosa]